MEISVQFFQMKNEGGRFDLVPHTLVEYETKILNLMFTTPALVYYSYSFYPQRDLVES